jgi:hypothetical protein
MTARELLDKLKALPPADLEKRCLVPADASWCPLREVRVGRDDVFLD